MTLLRPASISIAAVAVALLASTGTASAQSASARPAAKKPAAASKRGAKAAPKPAETVPPAAAPDQVEAAERVFYGVYECEFNQTVQIASSSKHPAYVDVKHGKADYLMKPVLSSTGAIRLEDVRGETLMVQISSKSMLLNVKTAKRIVDECVSPKQRELIDAARAAKAAEAATPAASAASAASAPSAAETAQPAAAQPPAETASPAKS